MKTLVTVITTLLFATISLAQAGNCDCKKDLDFLVTKMKEMPSYKRQIIKENKEAAFQTTYQEYASKMTTPISVISCFEALNKMMATLDDFHASVSFTNDGITKEQLADTAAMEAFVSSEAFLNHPKTTEDLVWLAAKLQAKDKNDVEGIYKTKELSVGVHRNETTNKLEGVVLESKLQTWMPGQIIFYLMDESYGRFDMLYFDPYSRKMIFSKRVSTANGRIKFFIKEGVESNEINFSKEKWVFKQINDSVQYIYFGAFSNTQAVKQASKEFYAKMKDSLDAKHLIIDLRNNGGGNKKHSDPFLKLFRKNKGQNYVLTNAFTASNAEQFTVKLKNIPNTLHLGEKTRGILAYGMNYGYYYETPSGLFSVLPTDMDFHNAFFEFEGKGIAPDTKLSYDTDWVSQTLDLISK